MSTVYHENAIGDKPKALKVNLDRIPAALKRKPRWVVWKYIFDGKRWNKTPFQVTNPSKRAKSNDRRTWGDFETARTVYEAGGFDGVGYMLGNANYGIDIDDCRDPITGDLTPFAVQLLIDFPSYAEVSPSGTGVKIFCYGWTPEGRNNESVEMYPGGRYFAVTGHVLWNTAVEYLQPQIDAHFPQLFPSQEKPRKSGETQQRHGSTVKSDTGAEPIAPPTEADFAVLAAIEASPDGERFKQLLAGDFSPWGNDQSAAHQSLCNWIAARNGRNTADVLRILSAIPSITTHPKWGRADYWKRTIAKAVNGSRSVSSYPSDHTDLANSRRFASQCDGQLLYCGAELNWRFYDAATGTWKRDVAGRAIHFAKGVVDQMIRDASAEAHDAAIAVRNANDADKSDAERRLKAARQQLKWAIDTAKNRSRITSMSQLASSDPELHADPSDFDADPLLLNSPNGAVELTSGRVISHSPSLLFAKCAATPFDPAAPCPLWEAFCYSIFGGDESLVKWVQRFLGYCLSGDTSIQLLPVFWGHGRNGKSTFMDTLAAVVGEYWDKAAPDLMLSKFGDTHPTEVADLLGLRLAFTVESDEGRKLNEARIKEFTGDATLKARRMRENFFTFPRLFKLVLITNHKPQVETGGDAIWRRLRLIPFTQRYWDSDRGETGPENLKADRGLPAKLLAERNGILAWLVRGAMAVFNDGMKLGTCKAIEDATRHYESAEDTFRQFVDAHFAITPNDADELPASDVRDLYQKWAAENLAAPLTPRVLTEKLLRIGVRRKESHGKTLYRGIIRSTGGG